MYPSDTEAIAAMAHEDLGEATELHRRADPNRAVAHLLAALVVATERQTEVMERLTDAVYAAGRDA